MKIVTIVGARPQFIKAAVVSRAIHEHNHLTPDASHLTEVLVHTGQHYDFNMSDVFFQELGMAQPTYYLGIGSGNHGEQTGRMLMAIEEVLLKERPDMVMVYGDTNSTLAGALAAAKLHIPVAHVEAGLRSYNRKMPEEVNRVLTDHVSSMLFCPSRVAVDNLRKEGFTNIANGGDLTGVPVKSYSVKSKTSGVQGLTSEAPHASHFTPHDPLVINIGDVMFDLALHIKEKVNGSEVLNKYNLKRKDFILVTIHRAENTDNEGNLRNIWEALIELAEDGKTIFFPAHPRTMNALTDHGLLGGTMPNHIILNAPVPYGEMIALESTARLVITDSGGVQKESYFFKTPCVIPRSQSEWVELVESRWAVLTGADRRRVVESASLLWERKTDPDWKAFYGIHKSFEVKRRVQ